MAWARSSGSVVRCLLPLMSCSRREKKSFDGGIGVFHIVSQRHDDSRGSQIEGDFSADADADADADAQGLADGLRQGNLAFRGDGGDFVNVLRMVANDPKPTTGPFSSKAR